MATADATVKDGQVIDRIGAALGVAPTHVDCATGPGTEAEALAVLQRDLAHGGVACPGTAVAYKKAKNSISFGPDPVEKLHCVIEGTKVTVSGWKNTNQRIAGMYFAGIACGTSRVDRLEWVGSANWAVTVGTVTPTSRALIDRIAKALKVAPTVVDCTKQRAALNGPQPGADVTGTFGTPVNLGAETTITLANPRVTSIGSSSSFNLDVTFVNRSSTTATVPDLSLWCNHTSQNGSYFLASSSEGDNDSSPVAEDTPVEPGDRVTGDIELRQGQLPGDDGKSGGIVTKCTAPAVIQIGDDGPTIPLPDEALNAWNAVAAKSQAGS
ncbi:MAG: hypothetical protein JST73_06735 [Actinobacteria bacterium]|nr:hypothetical protein [Actinomycetota bacterium]